MSAPLGQPEPLFKFNPLVKALHQALEDLPDERTGKNTRYRIKDAALGAFAVFFTPCPSFLAFQKAMEKAKGISNAQTLFEIEKVPCDNPIRHRLDPVAPGPIFPVFESIFADLDAGGHLKPFRSFNGHLLLALEATDYFSSPKIHCPQCSQTQHTNGTTTYSPKAITPVLVAPGREPVISLVPEFITPPDGHDKQDGETAAAKRWLTQYGRRFGDRGTTVLGDDLYGHQPMCEAILDSGQSFIRVCKPDSPKTLYEWIEGMSVPMLPVRRWTGRRHEIDTYRFVNPVPWRDGQDALPVNGCELNTTDLQGKVLYKNAFATHHRISAENVVELVRAGRTRWKIENENNNVLKTKGYHLEPNFGHGQRHLASLLFSLNRLAFLFHTVLALFDTPYQRGRKALPSRQTFFDDRRALTRYLCFPRWEALLDFMSDGLELTAPDTR